MKTAIVHEWLTQVTGSEKVVENIYKLYPSPIFVLVKDDELIKGTFFENLEIHTSFIQRLPGARKHYRNYLFLFPLAVEQFDLRDYDVILSSSHAVAKGVLTNSEQLHISYCHTPIRYAWDLYFEYIQSSGLESGIKGFLAKWILHNIRKFDVISASRPDFIIANSKYVQKRIKKIYRRDSTVIYPPVDVDKFHLSSEKEDFYIVVSRLVPYKKVDIVVKAFSLLPDRKLVVVGEGPEAKKVKKLAGKNVEFVGYQNEENLKRLYAKAKALINPQIEDFGITPVEAMASGTPVIAYARGGALETVVEGKTGIFFNEQSPEALKEAIIKFEEIEHSFSPEEIRQHSLKFSAERFQREYREFVERAKEEFFK